VAQARAALDIDRVDGDRLNADEHVTRAQRGRAQLHVHQATRICDW
jgi:hypothetical protein